MDERYRAVGKRNRRFVSKEHLRRDHTQAETAACTRHHDSGTQGRADIQLSEITTASYIGS